MPTEQHDAPVIIYGAPRSGTTYVKTILNQHPGVLITHETRVFAWLEEAWRKLPRDPRLVFGRREEFVEHLSRELPGVIRSFYRSLRPTRFWGDKNPHYASNENKESLQTIAELFPGARFVHVLRDGRDVVASLLRRGWASFDGAHEAWHTHAENGRVFGQTLPPGQYFELRYEELVRDDEAMARRLFDFLEIPMHPKVLAFCRSQREARTPVSGPTRDLTLGAAVSDWSVQLTTEQQVRSLELLAPYLRRFGYVADVPGAGDPDARPKPADDAPTRPELMCQIHEAGLTDGDVLVISKGDETLLSLCGHRARHFPQTQEGHYAGHHPADSEEAIAHLEALRAKGARSLVVPQTAFWWLDYYVAFRKHLETNHRLLTSGEDCVIYALHAPAAAGNVLAPPAVRAERQPG